MTANKETAMNRPMLLPWIAHRAGLPEQRVESLWREALIHARRTNGPQEDSAFWEAAQTHLHESIEREHGGLHLTTPEFGPLMRLQMRTARLPLLAWQGWSLAWVRWLARPHH